MAITRRWCGRAATRFVGASSAGPGRTLFGPTPGMEILAKKARIYGIALQTCILGLRLFRSDKEPQT
jgi:hypothetical protein